MAIATRVSADIELTWITQDRAEFAAEQARVRRVAGQLLRRLNDPLTLVAINEANAPGRSSALVQAAFLSHADKLGFVSEAKGLFAEYPTSGLRPDYFLRVGMSGILLEVERGKTTLNNMDILDFWKCHLCHHAHYLFLMVPRELRQNDSERPPGREYEKVVKRLGAFFVPRNYTNVRGAAIFGY